MKKDGIILKPSKDKAIRNRHHWIFSGAIQSMPEVDNGSILPVYSHDGEQLGSAYINTRTSITGRMIAFGDIDPYESIRQNISQAIAFRTLLFVGKDTTAYRLINAEGDQLPGLIVDKYNDTLVIQIATLGMEKLKPRILEILTKELSPDCIYEKSNLPARREEGLDNAEGVLAGTIKEHILIKENGIQFLVDIVHGQKTGFFLDQREMRSLVHSYAKDRTVLNCFSYTGGFSLYALTGGAARVDSVDISEDAMTLATKNISQNNAGNIPHTEYAEDVFEFLRQDKTPYNFIILDPPAFTKRKTDVVAACRGYKDINRVAMKRLPPKSFLLTSSCSHHVDEQLFQTVVFQAAREANRTVRIIQKHRLAPDHPINIYHREGEYLKSLLLFVE